MRRLGRRVIATLVGAVALVAFVGVAVPAGAAGHRQASSFPLVTTPSRNSTVATAPSRLAYTWDPGYSVPSASKLSFRTADRNATVCGHDAAGYPKLSVDPPAGAGSPVALTARCDVYASGGAFVSVVWANVTIRTPGVWTVRVAWGGGVDRDAFGFSYSPSLPRVTTLTSSVSTVSYRSCLGVAAAQVVLSWQTSDATSVSLTSPAGTETVPAGGSRTAGFPCDGLAHDYVLAATGPAGTAARTLRIGFAPSTPLIQDFRAEPASVSPRFCQTSGAHEVTLLWRTAEASQVTIAGPGFSATTLEPTGSRRVTFPCDGQPHDYSLSVRGYLGPNAPGSARTLTVRVLGAATAAACKYAPSTRTSWIRLSDVHLLTSTGPVTWLDPAGTALASPPAGFSPPGGTVVRAGGQRATLTLGAGATRVRLDLTPGSPLQFGVPEDPWAWVEPSGNGATLVRITNTPEPAPSATPPAAAPGLQGCVISDVRTALELQARGGTLVVRVFQDSVEVGNRGANPSGEPPVVTLDTGRFSTVSPTGRPSRSAVMSEDDYARVVSRYGARFKVPAAVRGAGTPWWVWLAIGAGAVAVVTGILVLVARRRRGARSSPPATVSWP